VSQQYQYKRMLTFCYQMAKLKMFLRVELHIWQLENWILTNLLNPVYYAVKL